jgi:hypothetical protein
MLIKFILVAILVYVEPYDNVVKTEAYADNTTYSTEKDCNTAKAETIESLEQSKSKNLKGYIVSCQKVELATPEVKQ